MEELAIFAKYWEPARVKTRLAAAIGAEAASQVSLAFLIALLRRLADSAPRRVVAFTPAERRDEFARLAGDAWSLQAQGDGDLGARLDRYFTAAFRRGVERAVVIGSDSPTVPASYLARAFELLRERPVVLGPTMDGGYYLVGAAQRVPPIFSGIDWGSTAVWQQTIQHLQQAGCPFAELPEWYDVDEVDALARLRRELQSQSLGDSPLAELLQAVRQALGEPAE
jgi:rSAM/selenodomain-associated transferase 1